MLLFTIQRKTDIFHNFVVKNSKFISCRLMLALNHCMDNLIFKYCLMSINDVLLLKICV